MKQKLGMKKNNIFSNLIFLTQRCYVLYIIAFISLTLMISHKRVVFKTLDYLNVVPGYLISYAQDQEALFLEERQGKVIRYYKNLKKIMTPSALIEGMLGFSYFHAGQYKRAANYYEKAISLDQSFFGFYYNLGVIYFKLGEYDQAINIFEQAVNVSPAKALSYAPYIDPFLPKEGEWSAKIKVMALQKAYNKCLKLKKASQKFIKGDTVLDVQVEEFLYFYPISQKSLIRKNNF